MWIVWLALKLLEVKSLILKDFFFVIAETKIDQAFPDSQF